MDLSIYTRGFFNKESKHEELCIKVLEDGKLKKEIEDSMAIIIPSNINIQDKDIQKKIKQSLKERIPIYFGTSIPALFSEKKFEILMKTQKLKTIEDNLNNISEIRYGVVGKVLTQNLKRNKVYVAHVWGINLEQRSTNDYKEFVNNSTKLIKRNEKFKDIMFHMIEIIDGSALWVEKCSKSNYINVLLPVIGSGAHLSQAKDSDKKWYYETFLQILNEVAKLSPKHKFFMYEKKQYNELLKKNNDFESSTTRKQQNLVTIVTEKNIFESAEKDFLPSDTVMIVNQWDSHSYIGNGGIHNSLNMEAILVSGCEEGIIFPNTSYLHNLLKKKEWMHVIKN